MTFRKPRSLIERIAVSLRVIPDTDAGDATTPATTPATRSLAPATGPGAPALPLRRFPSPDQWNDVVELDAREYPRRRVERHYRLVPTTCFNCESACGLLAYVDKQTGAIRKLEGNPVHPGSRGKNCAKGPATINQVRDPDRILAPMKRVGPRGGGQWKEVSWDEALADVGGRIRMALQENRKDEIVYHVGRPGAEGFMDRVLRAWGVDGHNSHTNICSAGARFGYAIWSGYDRPSPDYANARFILALNAHLESGHYFNPHAQRISEALAQGAKLAVVDPRLSNTASCANYWLPTKPGTEAALLLAFARVILEEGLHDRAFIERWVNWREYLEGTQARRHEGTKGSDGATEGRSDEGTEERTEGSRDQGIKGSAGVSPASLGGAGVSPVNVGGTGVSPVPMSGPKPPERRPEADAPQGRAPREDISVDDFIEALKREYARFTPEFAERECGIPAATVVEIARLIGQAGPRFCSHTWRGAASAHLGGWQVSRCLFFLHALTGSVGTVGGCSPSAWNKYKADLIDMPPPQDHWNELHWPRAYPLGHYEMSFLLPHFLLEGRGKIDVYFTRVFNPVWTYPDGFTWIEALSDESKIGLHVALTPTWNETAFYADYVLPMGHGPERHDLNTYETHNAVWIAFRQPVLRAHARAEGRAVRDTRDVNPGQVWEEDEFWIALCWAIDPDGTLGVRQYFESPNRPGEKLSVDEYYAHIFERVPGLPEAAQRAGLSALDYMRKFGAFEVAGKVYLRHERLLEKGTEGRRAEGTEGRRDEGTEGRVGDPPRSVSGVGVPPVPAPGSVGVPPVPAPGSVGVPPARSSSRPPEGAAPEVGENTDPVEGFPTPSRKLEFYSRTMVDWDWPEHAIPGYIASHIWEGEGTQGHRDEGTQGLRPFLDACLLPTFRLPTLIHTRSGAAKWLNEISQRNPIWIHTSDARRLGVRTGELVRLTTEIGYFVDKVWVTESIRPGVVACSHHLGRWRRANDPPNSRWSGSVVSVQRVENTPGAGAGDSGHQPPAARSNGAVWRMRIESGPRPFDSPDPDSRRLWWRDGGVPQNLTHAVHPDPISGMHCWHQRVRVEKAQPDDRCGDVLVDTAKSMQVYRAWLKRTRASGVEKHKLRRPLWLNRPLKPAASAYEA